MPAWPDTRPSLLLQLRQGQAEDAWQVFLATYVPLVYGYCRKSGLQAADAEDVTQTVMQRVSRFAYDATKGRFRGWLGKVVRNEIHAYLRRQTRAGQGLGQEDVDAPAEVFDHHADDPDWDRLFHSRVLERALERIRPEFSKKEWQVCELVFVRPIETSEGRSWEVVAAPDHAGASQVVGESVGWVYKAKFKIKRRLKGEILYLAEEEGILR